MMSPRQRPRPGIAPTWHIGVLVSVGQVIGNPRHDGAEEDLPTENTFRNHLRPGFSSM